MIFLPSFPAKWFHGLFFCKQFINVPVCHTLTFPCQSNCQYSPISLLSVSKNYLGADHLILKPGWYLLNLFGNEQLINWSIILQFQNPKGMKEFRNLEEKKADWPQTSWTLYQFFLLHICEVWKIYTATCQSWSIKAKPKGCQKNLPRLQN